MARLEALRLETDSRRRTVEALSEAYEKKKSQLGRAPTHKAETEAEMTLRRMHHKEDKLQRTGTAFSEMEQTVRRMNATAVSRQNRLVLAFFWLLLVDSYKLHRYFAGVECGTQAVFECMQVMFPLRMVILQPRTNACYLLLSAGVQQSLHAHQGLRRAARLLRGSSAHSAGTLGLLLSVFNASTPVL